jgi:hypothetical protein
LGINIVGKLTPAQGNYTFTVVVVEYFMKWVEVNPSTNVSFASIKKFFWQNIICRYGVPRHITIDNTKFKDFCHEIGMKVAFASVYHPQTNEAVEYSKQSKNPRRRKERKMGRGYATSSMEP